MTTRAPAAIVILLASFADPAVSASGPISPEVETVIVTALRRPSAAQDTPLPLTALPSHEIEAAGIDSITDLASHVPGLTAIQNGVSNTRFAIRGIQGVGEPIVGVHYDETAMTGLVGATNDAGGSTPLLSLVDVDRVEVLRGPQGTLYGAGAMTGAIRVLWTKPKQEHEWDVALEGSGANRGSMGWHAEGIANVPLMDDVLATRVVAYAGERAGYVDNVVLGTNDVDRETTRGARVSVRLTPSAQAVIDATAVWQRIDGDTPLWAWDLGNYRSANRARLLNDDEQSLFNITATWRFTRFEALASFSRAERNVDQVNSDVTYQFLTNIDNPAICARLRGGGAPCSAGVQASFNDYVRSHIPGVVYPRQNAVTNSGEVRLYEADGEGLDWTIGAYGSTRTGDLDNVGLDADPASGDLITPYSYSFRRHVDEELRQRALFGELTWNMSRQLSMTVGARSFRYNRAVGGETTLGLDLINAPVLAYQRATSEEDGEVFRVNVAHRPTRHLMFYAGFSQGYRPGGANQVVNLPAALVPYQPDEIANYELGMKSSWWDERVTLNADVFRMDWDDMQVSGSRPDGLFRFISNAGEARADGFEFEASLQTSERFKVGSNIALVDARLTDDQVTANVVAPGRDGDRIPYAPKLMAGLNVEQQWSVSEAVTGLLRIDTNYVGARYSELRPNNPYYRRVPDFVLLNARISLRPNSHKWEVTVFCENLLDRVAVQSVTASGLTVGRTLVVTLPPRTVGLEFRTRL